MHIKKIAVFPLYPFVLAIMPVLQVYDENMAMVLARDLVRPILAHGLGVAILVVVCRLVRSSLSTAGLLAGAIAYVFFWGGDLPLVWTLVFLAAIPVLALFLRRTSQGFRSWSVAFNVVALLWLSWTSLQIARDQERISSVRPRPGYEKPVDLPASRPPTKDRPDLYYVIVDGLGRADVLKKQYGIPMATSVTPFESIGFRFAAESRANYAQTALSVATTLNMEFLEALLERPGEDANDRRPLATLISQSKSVATLRALGYRIVSIPGGYNLTELHTADIVKNPRIRLDYVQLYLEVRTLLRHVGRLLGQGPALTSFPAHRHRIRSLFDALPRARRGVPADEPVFVLAHILAPHPPFVFGRDGRSLRSTRPFEFKDADHWRDFHKGDGQSYVELYRDQATYVLEELVESLQKIVAGSSRPVLIVVQGDHGPGSLFQWDTPNSDGVHERFAIFNAWYASPGIDLEIDPAISPVNTFRLILNTIYDTQLPLYPNRSLFSTWNRPYRLYDIGSLR